VFRLLELRFLFFFGHGLCAARAHRRSIVFSENRPAIRGASFGTYSGASLATIVGGVRDTFAGR
jgi:hypothetical protein